MKKDIKKFLTNIIVFIFIIIIIFTVLILVITQLPTEQFRNSYQYAINLKYKNLKETDKPKIIIVGGSNAAFAINAEIIENKTNMKVVNLGLHAGFGAKFQTELAKVNINEGDIVVLAYEYDSYTDIDRFGAELIVTGIDNNLEIYKFVSPEQMIDVIRYFPTYVLKKLDSINNEKDGQRYHIDLFDSAGNMIYYRKECILPKILNEKNGMIAVDKIDVSEEAITYINNFTMEVEKLGGNVLLTFPPILEDALYVDEKQIGIFENIIDEKLYPERISNVSDYIFTREYIYDTIYHCNTEGEKVRSEKLANDILKYVEN